ncbi:MAG: PaaI family thioesterase, partial [Acidimicrobiales bacterium]
ATPISEQASVSDARARAAGVLRRLGHSLVGHDAPDELFERLIDAVVPLIDELETGQERDRSLASVGGGGPALGGDPPTDGAPLSHFPDCVVSGAANPMGIAIGVRCEAGEAVAEVTLGAAFEGAPGRAHGGVVAAIFDDVMGYVLSIHKVPAFTGRLTVTYRAPTPVGEPLTFRARLDRHEDRKLHISATAHTRDGDELLAEASATFIVIPIERFMPTPSEAPE